MASRRRSAGAGDMPAPSLSEVSHEVLLAHATYHSTAGDEQQPPTLGMGLGASHGRGAVMRAEGGVGTPPLCLGRGGCCGRSLPLPSQPLTVRQHISDEDQAGGGEAAALFPPGSAENCVAPAAERGKI